MTYNLERRWTSALVWTALFLFATYVMVGVQGEITEAHVALVYLLIILGSSSHSIGVRWIVSAPRRSTRAVKSATSDPICIG